MKFKQEKYTHLAKFARRHLSAPSYSVYSVRLFSEDGNLEEQNQNQLLQKGGENLLLQYLDLKKTRTGFFVA